MYSRVCLCLGLFLQILLLMENKRKYKSMSKRSVAILRDKPRKTDFCHKMKNIKKVGNNSGWFNTYWMRRDLQLTEAHHGLHTTSRKAAQLITTEGMCMSGDWGQQAPTPKWWQRSWAGPGGRPGEEGLGFVSHDWMLVGFTRPATSPADPGELRVGINHGHSHTTLTFCQPVHIAACEKPWTGKNWELLLMPRAGGIGPDHPGSLLLGWLSLP